MYQLKGNKIGQKLWKIMAVSEDQKEREYFNRILKVIESHGNAWFTDIVSRRTKENQNFWYVKKVGESLEISLFQSSGKPSNERIDSFEDFEIFVLNENDLI